jgi:hypothetical protein
VSGAGSEPRRLRLTPRAALGVVGLAGALALLIVRAAVEDRTPLRGLNLRGLWFEQTTVDPGQTVTRELTWVPERDVYLVGWNALVLAPWQAAHASELTLFDGGTRIFVMVESGSPPADALAWHPAELPAGTGYRVHAGRTLTLRLRIANQGAGELLAETAGAQIRYVPVS